MSQTTEKSFPTQETVTFPRHHNIAILGKVKFDDEQRPSLVPRSSFWQTLRIRRAIQDHEPFNLIQHEDVLVFRKSVQQRKER